jgi:hypothetical protein
LLFPPAGLWLRRRLGRKILETLVGGSYASFVVTDGLLRNQRAVIWKRRGDAFRFAFRRGVSYS